ncbi:cytochrome P450 [Mycolicibacterium novocastrense]|uniref:Cytochrome P450 n=1 Tax=Mycolicibacterium novocastrense TaxID=59813 RepID=A0AAW5SKI6_MYCNV|nr:cytochrome P450 [Mycolicibacterium novocastrense]MCV7024304.1 cytochrome P450 [Mycolicibacterium novocastrense]GAT06872.1 cytochrome P450 [Mycolicibacterium novocastrense]
MAEPSTDTQQTTPGPAAAISVPDTLRVVAQVIAPTLAQGVIIRRPAAMVVAERLQLDGRAVAILSWLRARHGRAPLLLRIPGRSVAILLDAGDVAGLLRGAPEPFAPSTPEKRAALAHFQPHGVLASAGQLREKRRAFNEAALQTQQHVHPLAPTIVGGVLREVAALLDRIKDTGSLSWNEFAPSWWRIVRGTVLGDAARPDEQLTDNLARLRRRANWAYVGHRDKRTRRRFDAAVQQYLDRAERGSLAEAIAQADPTPQVDAADQVAHWLFAFDAAGMTTFRALALLSTHPDHTAWVREELDTDLSQPQSLQRLRACALDTVRLWPTTPVILRESTTPTVWHDMEYPTGTTFLVYAPLFHRDAGVLDFADRFAPHIWLDGRARQHPELVPFSAGPGVCPGQNVVLLTVSTALAALLQRHRFEVLAGPPLTPRVPAVVSPFRLRFGVRPSAP